jgi:hypothetical protein
VEVSYRMKELLTRRAFLGSVAIAACGIGGAAAWYRREAHLKGVLLSAFEDARGDQYVGGVTLETGTVFGARVPMRAHGCAIDPTDPQRTIFFARRPGTQAYEFDRNAREVRTVFTTPAGRHLSGHGVFSPRGDLLYVPEHDYEHVRGVVTVRDARTFAVLHEIDTLGIDPHEIAWHPDGRTLLVANGGILTHPRTFRRKLNIGTMDPSLCAIDARTGECREQWRLPHHQLSIRHLAVTSDGSVVAGLQYEGAHAAPGVIAVQRPGTALRLLDLPAQITTRLKGYVASVAVSEPRDLIAAACPYGSGVACWSLRDARYRGFVTAAEAYGLSRLADGSVLASQRDGTALRVEETRLRSQFLSFTSARPIRWDDHWVAVT